MSSAHVPENTRVDVYASLSGQRIVSGRFVRNGFPVVVSVSVAENCRSRKKIDDISVLNTDDDLVRNIFTDVKCYGENIHSINVGNFRSILISDWRARFKNGREAGVIF